MTYHQIIQAAQPFLTYIVKVLEELKCDVSVLELDHICYRVRTQEEYLELKTMFTAHGKLLSEKEINGREISVFKLVKPIVFGERKIDLFELPSPKKGSDYSSGYEHVEFVVKDDLRIYTQQNPHLNFHTKGIDKAVNPEIRLNFEKGTVKFHNHNLQYVIECLD